LAELFRQNGWEIDLVIVFFIFPPYSEANFQWLEMKMPPVINWLNVVYLYIIGSENKTDRQKWQQLEINK